MPIRHWTLATKLVATGFAFLLLALASIGLTLWVTWQLEGGAAAVNEAGRMRMLSYRLALQSSTCAAPPCAVQTGHLDAILQRLAEGDPSRPLFVPWNAQTRAGFESVRSRWAVLSLALREGRPVPLEDINAFVGLIDGFVSAIEHELSDWTTVLRGFQFTMVLLAIASAVAILYAGYLLVLNPLSRLQQGIQALRDGRFDARVPIESKDEFGELAAGFNQMAEHLQALYGQLEDKVREKTARLQAQHERLAALYNVSSFISQADTLEHLAQGFAERVRIIANADAVAIRWSDERNERYLLLASSGLPVAMSETEHCLPTGSCHCGQPVQQAGTRVIPITAQDTQGPQALGHCAQFGYRTLVSVPVKVHQRMLGEIDLFFREAPNARGPEEESLFEALAAHLASAMEGLRAAAMEKEAAVANERSLIARELHDSIAQSLAFMKIQVQLLRDALKREDRTAVERVIGELDTGVRESYSDVRELLVHFRTRTNAEDIEPALRATLQKFEHQTGLATELHLHGHGLPLPPDTQVQVLHVVQEALSNVRKHAGARHVRVDVHPTPTWRFEVADDGCGFDPQARTDETHVGLRIMRERADRIGAEVQLHSAPGQGTRVVLTLPGNTAQAGEATENAAV